MHGDTAKIPFGMGTYGSRSLAVGGTAIVKAIDKVVAKGKKIAAHLLEAAEGDIEFKDGKFTVAGTDKAKTLRRDRADRLRAAQLSARRAGAGARRDRVLRSRRTSPSRRRPHLRGRDRSGHRRRCSVVSFTAVDDFGSIINPMIVEGQVHGGIAQGIGQALLESARLRRQTASSLTGSFMDYACRAPTTCRTFTVGDRSDTLHAQSAGREGLRRSRRDRLAARRHQRRGRRAEANSACGTSICRPRPQKVWAHHQQRHEARPAE